MEFKRDNFGGAIISSKAVEAITCSQAFESALADTLATLRADNTRGVWISIPIGLSTFIPVAVKQGFVFHHAKPSSVTMSAWLPEGVENTLPPYAQSFIGVGGICINSKNQILSVVEKYRYLDTRKRSVPYWKIPTGMYDLDEDTGLGNAIEREIKEETGVTVKFRSILAIFHQFPDIHFGERVNLFFACRCEPVSEEISVDKGEICDAKWMDFEDFAKQGRMNDALYKMVMQYESKKEMGEFHSVDPRLLGVQEVILERYKYYNIYAGLDE